MTELDATQQGTPLCSAATKDVVAVTMMTAGLDHSYQDAPRNWLWPAICCAVVLFSILLANPFNEAGFIDDWSFARVALNLAKTGHFEYNGWGAPLLVFQAIWVLPWIKLFGFSFQLLQISMVPIALGFVLMVYALGRQIGLPRNLAAFASIAVGTSPLFIPVGATFMTDVTGALFSMFCVYTALKSVSTPNPDHSIRWLWALALAGVIGGANRQIVWVGPVLLIPYLAWMYRRNLRFSLHAAAAYTFCGAAILALLHLLAPPYSATEVTRQQLTWILHNDVADPLRSIFTLFFVGVLTSVPVFCCFLGPVRRMPPLSLGLVFAGALLCTLVELRFRASTATSILALTINELPAWTLTCLTLITNSCALGTILFAWRARPLKDAVRRDQTLQVFGIFSLGYVSLLLPPALIVMAYDRYMLPLIPLLVLVALRIFSRYERPVPIAAWVYLAVFGLYGAAATHNFYEITRTRIAIAHELERSGVSKDRISAGFEYDGWNQLERTGYVRGPRFQDNFVDTSSRGFWPEFWDHLEGFRPDFVVVDANLDTPLSKSILTKHFRAWLPPFDRSVGIWKRTDLKVVDAWQRPRLSVPKKP